jgi:hypothetical protein
MYNVTIVLKHTDERERREIDYSFKKPAPDILFERQRRYRCHSTRSHVITIT